MPMMVLSTQKVSAPTTPTGLQATAISATEIDLTWNASSNVSGCILTGYRVYRDGVLAASPSGTSYQDTGLTEGTLHAYRVASRALDADSGLSSAASATTISANSDPVWDATISEALTISVAYDRPLDDLCFDPDGDTITYSASAVQDAPPSGYTAGLPPGCTLIGGHIIGTPTSTGNYAYTVDADDDPVGMDADFEARATAAGVTYACNATDVYVGGVLQPARTITDSTSLRNEALDTGGTPTNLVRDTVLTLSGTGSIQLITPGSAGVDGGAHWSYRPNGTDSTQFTRFYAQMSIYMTRDGHAYRYQLDAASQPAQLKIWNIEQNGAGQIAITARMFLGFPSYFTQTATFHNSGDASLGTPNPWGNSQEWIQNAINNGGTAAQTKNAYIAKYGPLEGIGSDVTGAVSGQPAYSAGDPLLYNRTWPSGWPDARAIAAGGVPFNLDGWTTIGIFVDYNVGNPTASTFQGWAAAYLEAPQLIFSQIGNCPLGTNDVYRRFELLAYDTHRVSETGVRPEIRTNYSEVIVSTAPINFPGGFTLPSNQG